MSAIDVTDGGETSGEACGQRSEALTLHVALIPPLFPSCYVFVLFEVYFYLRMFL